MGVKEVVERHLSSWMKEEGPEGDAVLSSRIRLARNLVELPFPRLAQEEYLKRAFNAIRQATENAALEGLGELHFLSLAETPPLERSVLVEKHLISPEEASDVRYKGVILTEDETVSIMVNEEDHLRIQSIRAGLNLESAWETANRLDDFYESRLEIAFSEKRGYLTACPTNVGTGLRASVMLHLPGLAMTDQVRRLVAASGQLGLAVRGLFGEGSEAAGNIFQISNQLTLGHTEEEIVQHLTAVAKQIVQQEREARRAVQEQARLKLEDRIGRAFGLLANARQMTASEAIQLLSELRLGVVLGLVKGLSLKAVNELMVAIRPSVLQKIMGRELEPEERDIHRAALLRECLAGAST
ncbi:MAG: protein arginine kinase [Bacillota bacterium]|nr:protein arginine kinase [Bacillota bacterium]